MTEKKKPEKRPLDMTTDEAMEFLLGREGAQKLKGAVQGMNPPPTGASNGKQKKGKSAQKHNS